jgi:hypothetical protein
MIYVLEEWARRWEISPQAIADLGAHLAAPASAPGSADTEAGIVGAVRLQASEAGWTLFRNNVGACYDPTGRFIRYGLANDSAQLNAALKSSDLVGIRPVIIDPTHLGRTIGQFVALECKRPNWTFKGTKREEAQQRFLTLVASNGGYARFSTGEL